MCKKLVMLKNTEQNSGAVLKFPLKLLFQCQGIKELLPRKNVSVCVW